ncbi:Predicted Zn-finger-like protein, possible nucleic acid binding [Clostridium acetobutylicum ATCC 824]|uniref:Predicted Zn-finger-like protein, possible nucleic acid binding n=2 Tax=Clostridium acetobutylicum TaxID=1488 RepID=Q97IA8_CLOAB|nr:Predicted Zn-finger-like protein, possible nucleic acid binding [Clostridium acetobutylicum ATCC 824]
MIMTLKNPRFLEPLTLKGKLLMDNSIIPLYAEVKGIVELTCSRCLQKFPYDIDLEIDEKFTDNPENKDDEVIFINNYEVDINEIVENNIILSLPIKKLCREDCKGLCPMCGTNLNISTCNCHEDNIDPRFAKLKDLFSNH